LISRGSSQRAESKQPGHRGPLCSVVVPFWNVGNLLSQCLEGLLAQTNLSFEVLLVDDGSGDYSSDIALQFASRYRNFRYLRISHSGLSVARNEGLRLAQGKWVLFLDADDVLSSDTIATVEASDRADSVDVIRFLRADFDSLKPPIGPTRSEPLALQLREGPDAFAEKVFDGDWDPSACPQATKRKLLLENGLLFVPGLLHEDNLWTPQTWLAARLVAQVDEVHYWVRRRQGSLSNSPASLARVRGLFAAERALRVLSLRTTSPTGKQALLRLSISVGSNAAIMMRSWLKQASKSADIRRSGLPSLVIALWALRAILWKVEKKSRLFLSRVRPGNLSPPRTRGLLRPPTAPTKPVGRH
jgi:glycosyltransferase involved in cell wall biosynthesis